MESLAGKRLLILGGTTQACDAVLVAKKLGIEVFVADYYADSPAKRIADQSFMASTHEVEQIVALCKDCRIDGVMAVCLEDVLPFYYEICRRMGLPCYLSPEQIRIFNQKSSFKQLCAQAGLPTIPQLAVAADTPLQQLQKLPYPILIKPTDSSSSRGVSVCFGPQEVPAAIGKALEFSDSKTFLAEKYMQCEDVIINYTFADGEYRLSLMGDRFVSNEYKNTGSVTKALIYPSVHLSEYLETTHPLVCDMFRKANIRDGVMFIQAFYEDGKFYCYDPGYRTCGAQVYKMVEAANGVPQMEMLIRHALTGSMGDRGLLERNDPYLHGQAACNLVILLKPGRIGAIEGGEAVQSDPAVINYTQFLDVGDAVTQVGTLKQTFARIHLLCRSREELKEAIRRVQGALKVTDACGESLLLPDFDVNRIPMPGRV